MEETREGYRECVRKRGESDHAGMRKEWRVSESRPLPQSNGNRNRNGKGGRRAGTETMQARMKRQSSGALTEDAEDEVWRGHRAGADAVVGRAGEAGEVVGAGGAEL